MKKETKELLKEVVKFSLILLVAGILISLLLFKASFNVLIIYSVGWATALLNLFLLAFAIMSLTNKQLTLIGIPIFAFRYLIYGVSMYFSVNNTLTGIYWSAGVITLVISVMIGGISSQKRKEEKE